MSLNQIWTDLEYVYAATSSGADIVDLISEQKISFIDFVDGFTTVFADDYRVYFGTQYDYIKYINKSCISGSISTPYDLTECLFDFGLPYGLTNSGIRYIHGSGDFLGIVTMSGVDIYKKEPQGYRSSCTTVSGNAYKCFVMSDGCFYYTVSGSEWSIDRIDHTSMDWTTPGVSHVAGGSIIESSVKMNDIFVTEETSSDGIHNTLFIATSSGIYVIDEGTETHEVYYKGIVAGTSDNFIVIWADPTASLTNGRFYVSSSDVFSVVESSNQSLYDFYTSSHAGRGGEALLSSDIVDINC